MKAPTSGKAISTNGIQERRRSACTPLSCPVQMNRRHGSSNLPDNPMLFLRGPGKFGRAIQLQRGTMVPWPVAFTIKHLDPLVLHTHLLNNQIIDIYQ